MILIEKALLGYILHIISEEKYVYPYSHIVDLQNELRALLAQEQEPVAWMSEDGSVIGEEEKDEAWAYTRKFSTPLYAKEVKHD